MYYYEETYMLLSSNYGNANFIYIDKPKLGMTPNNFKL